MSNPYEKLFMSLTALSLFFTVQMLVNIPGMDLPDIKDSKALFPNLNPEPTAQFTPHYRHFIAS